MLPYLPDGVNAKTGRELPQAIQERKKEIRTFMPRYGCINERKHQLHEVIRLSGMNIIIGDVDRPLIIKVASISSARIQVYFIDNEDYFKRKSVYTDENGKFFEDNGERAIFYARGVLETVKKLRWEPDVIHCQGWISNVLPLYLKKAYKDDPIFAESKVVVSLQGGLDEVTFDKNFPQNVLFSGITPEDIPFLDEANGINLAKTAASYSDGIIMASDDVDSGLAEFCASLGKPVLPFNAKAIEDGSYADEYNNFYDQL